MIPAEGQRAKPEPAEEPRAPCSACKATRKMLQWDTHHNIRKGNNKMPSSERKKAYDRVYSATHQRPIKFSFSIENDADVLAMLDSVPNKQGYVKALIRADIAARAKSEEKKEEQTMPIRINFEAGTSRSGSHAVNFMMPAPGANSPDLYAEIPVPEGAEEDYGYLTLKQEILRQASAQNIPAEALSFWYDGQEDLLSPAARAGQRAKTISLDNRHTFISADQGAYLEIAARKMWPVVVAAMDDATREYVAREGIDAPDAFLARYLELAPCDLCIG